VISGQERRPRRAVPEGPQGWLWFVGIARIAVLILVAGGAYRLGTYYDRHLGYFLGYFLLALYSFALATSVFCLASLRRGKAIPALLTWTQILLDFGVVAATVSATGGATSFLTFLLVIVILEAGLLLGLAQGFVFATLATVFAGVQAAVPTVPLVAEDWVEVWYSFLIRGLGFYLTAFVSGHWNQRIYRMEQFQRTILDNMNSGFLFADPDGTVTALNRVGTRILNVNEQQALGKPVDEVIRASVGRECPVRTALRTGRDFISYEFPAVMEPNQAKLLGLTTSRIYDPHRKLAGIIASFTDLTEIARMREELHRQDRLAVVGELAAELAHEIRNPIAAIRGAVDELASNLSAPQMARQLTDIAIRESDHLNEILSGFLDFARNPSTRRDRFDLRRVVEEVKDLLHRESGATDQLRMHAILPEEPCEVSGDPSQIKQVFTNLGRNAIDAMCGNGALTITVIPAPRTFEVRFDDEGPGIPPDMIARIFEPFYTTKEKGVGMGLAVSLRIVTAHDGTIRAAPREGGGATMTVHLPAAQ